MFRYDGIIEQIKTPMIQIRLNKKNGKYWLNGNPKGFALYSIPLMLVNDQEKVLPTSIGATILKREI